MGTPPSSLFEAVERKRGLIERIAHRYIGSGGCKRERELPPFCRVLDVLKSEIDRRIMPLPDEAPPGRHGVEDGGSGLRDLAFFQLYVVKAWAAVYEGNGDKYSVKAEARGVDTGLIYPPLAGETRSTMFRETLEAVVARRAILDAMGGGLFLWDGGLRQLLWARRPWTAPREPKPLPQEAAEALLGGSSKEYLERLHDEVEKWHEEEPLSILRRIVEALDSSKLADWKGLRWLPYLEWYEKMIAIKKLLEEAWRTGTTLVFVTKTSRSQSLLKSMERELNSKLGTLAGLAFTMTDVYALNLYEPRLPFTTRPIVRHGLTQLIGLDKYPWETVWLPPYGGLRELFNERLVVLELYARLERDKPILKIQIVLDLERNGEILLFPEDQIALAGEVLERILSLSQKTGYPWKLVEADRRAKVGHRDLEMAQTLLGLRFQFSPREGLGVGR